jgi:hypothetical protein
MPPARRKGGGGANSDSGGKRSAGGKSWWGKGGFEGEVASNLIDVVCTWFFMGGLALSAVWVEWGIPYFCSGADPKDKV